MKNIIGIVVQLLLAAAISYLAFSIYSVNKTVTTAINSYPKLFEDIEQLTDGLEIEQWLQLAQRIETLTPDLLILAKKLQTTAADINQTAASIDKKIPLVLNEVAALRTTTIPEISQTIEIINSQILPPTLLELSEYRTSVVPVLSSESKAYRTVIIPTIIEESQHLRTDVPMMLAEVNKIVDKGELLTEQVAQGAVKGVILSPLHFLHDAREEIGTKLTDDNNE